MRHAVLIWTGTVMACAASAVGAPPGTPAVPLDVAGIELVRLPAVARALLEEEAARLLAPGGVRVAWRWRGARHESPAHELRVAFLDSPGRGAHAGRTVLAASGLTGPAASVWVYVPNVSRALGLRAFALAEAPRDLRDLGVALGRVVAHEVVHALAPEVPHGEGLMAARFHLGHLAREEVRLDDGGARALLAAAREWASRGGPLPAPERLARASAAGEAVLPGAP